MDQDKTVKQIKVKGNQLVDKIREIIEEGNARRIIIKKDGRSVMELPLSVGMGGAAAAVLISPMLAAVGAFAALVSHVDVEIETTMEKQTPPTTPVTTPPAGHTPGAGVASGSNTSAGTGMASGPDIATGSEPSV